MPSRLRVVLVRHGESVWNLHGRLQGHAGEGLTERGHAQAETVAAHLERSVTDAVAIVHSDLARAAESVAPTVKCFDLPVVEREEWREIDVGSWAGRTWEEVAVTDPEGHAAALRGEDVVVARGGESREQLRARVWHALDVVADGHEAGTVLVFTHGGCVRAAAARALGAGSEARLGGVANGSLSVLGAAPDGAWRLLAYNETAHLDRVR